MGRKLAVLEDRPDADHSEGSEIPGIPGLGPRSSSGSKPSLGPRPSVQSGAITQYVNDFLLRYISRSTGDIKSSGSGLFGSAVGDCVNDPINGTLRVQQLGGLIALIASFHC